MWKGEEILQAQEKQRKTFKVIITRIISVIIILISVVTMKNRILIIIISFFVVDLMVGCLGAWVLGMLGSWLALRFGGWHVWIFVFCCLFVSQRRNVNHELKYNIATLIIILIGMRIRWWNSANFKSKQFVKHAYHNFIWEFNYHYGLLGCLVVGWFGWLEVVWRNGAWVLGPLGCWVGFWWWCLFGR